MSGAVRFTEFCDEVIKINSDGKPFTLGTHQRVISDLADDLYEQDAWNQFLYSTIKKSGKTEFNGAKCIHWAHEHDGDELIVQGNDYDQSVGRVFTTIAKLCTRNKIKHQKFADTIIFPNDSVIRAISNDPGGEAGANQGFHSVDEPWAVTKESALQLLEELTPILTKPSIRFISTYAGWIGQSQWLWNLYLQGVSKDIHPEGKAERIHDELPIFLNREVSLFCYWDSGVDARRMPWQKGPKAEKYYRQQQTTMRAGAFSRLHLNQWGAGDDKFISAEAWESIVDPRLRPISQGARLFGGWDASTKRDSTAVVFVAWDEDRIRIACHRIFTPKRGQPIDFDEVENYVREVCARHSVVKINADPYQLFSTIQKMQKENIPVEEFNQSLPNLTMMASTMNDKITDRTLVTYPADDLKAHALNAIAADGPRGMTIKKERAAGKIDSFIALAMAVMGAVETGYKPPFNPRAVPTGIGQSQFFGNARARAMNQTFPNSTFGPPLEDTASDIFSLSYAAPRRKVAPVEAAPKPKEMIFSGESEWQRYLKENNLTEARPGHEAVTAMDRRRRFGID